MESILNQQHAVIAVELAHLERAKANLPTLHQGEWLGNARAAYALCLMALHHEVDTLIDRLRSARNESSRAAQMGCR